jgi:RNA polymerase sigma-70 factor (ECF subfamily)
MAAADERIAELLAEGSPEAIELLYDAYGTLAYTLALRIVTDPHTAEDVIQDAFLAVWRRADQFRSERGTVKSWLCQVVRNCAIDRLRSNRRKVAMDVPIDAATAEPSVSDTWAGVAAALTRQEVQVALRTLPPEQRQTVELAFFDGYSQTEISRAMDVPLGTVKGRARLALTRLRGVLEREESWQSR